MFNRVQLSTNSESLKKGSKRGRGFERKVERNNKILYVQRVTLRSVLTFETQVGGCTLLGKFPLSYTELDVK